MYSQFALTGAHDTTTLAFTFVIDRPKKTGLMLITVKVSRRHKVVADSIHN